MNKRIIPEEYASLPGPRPSLSHLDPLANVPLEEAVLSSMISGRPVRSLGPEHFTSNIRAAMYGLLVAGMEYGFLDDALRAQGFDEGERAYVTDCYLTPMLPHQPLVEAVAELKRLALVRTLCEAVDIWRDRAPTLSYERAIKELGQAIRGDGTYRRSLREP
jgi:hypothetical protein